MNGETLETIDKFKYMGATLTKDEQSEKEIKIRLATANSTLVNLSTIWKSRSISIRTKIHLYKSMIHSIILYGCETWTLNKTLEKRINAFESKSYKRILGISYRERKTNDNVFKIIIEAIGYVKPLLSTIKRRKLYHFSHTIRHESIHKLIMQGFIELNRRQGRPRTNWISNIIE